MLRLIVNADDLGVSEKINDGIVYAHLNGIVTSTSIIACGSAFEHAISVCRETPTLDMGIHLTLVEERPILDPALIPSLVDSEGTMHRDASIFAKKLLLGKIRLGEVRLELEAQIDQVLSLGMPVSHFDSHDNLHVLPGIARITGELAEKHGIPAIRYPRERLRSYMFRQRGAVSRGDGAVSRILQSMALAFFCQVGEKRLSALQTDYCAGFFFGGNLNKLNLLKVLGNLPSVGTCELMCHPGFDDPDPRFGHWGYHHEDELDALTDPEISAFLQNRDVELISYRQITT